MVDIALAAVDVVAVVYVMLGAFKHHRLFAEARRHLSYVLRGWPHQPGPDAQIVQTAVDDYTRPASRRIMTADLRPVSPRHRGPGRAASADPQADRPAVRAGPPRRRRAQGQGPGRASRGPSRLPHPAAHRRRARRPQVAPAAVPHRPEERPPPGAETGVDTVEKTCRTFEAAARLAAKLQDGRRERAVTHGPRPQPAPATAPQPHTQQPGTQHTPSRTTGGVV